MANSFCSVDNCVRRGEVELDFPGEHGSKAVRFPHKTLLCVYHVRMMQEVLAEQGFDVPPVQIDVRPTFPRGFVGDQRRFAKQKPRDDADYDRGYGE